LEDNCLKSLFTLILIILEVIIILFFVIAFMEIIQGIKFWNNITI
jgi:hypothetical protein